MISFSLSLSPSLNIDVFQLVEEFFKDIKDIQKLLQSQIFVTIDRMLTVVRKDPKQLVTALRIIEREEMFVIIHFEVSSGFLRII